ncbi:Sensory box histidine kinase/response regulator [Labilithrix luteola]|uniref:histidine kinase n=1 Tax=Labilithrix luteola TaxID=1391654 RepID=A0A0K1Q5K4_9BACT|nr:PAS domain-containing sensor histidine kinase [Labilithrix luteola]AKV01018.1 Sensory box histidine kinase/response regulator [Labilithrix luteola]
MWRPTPEGLTDLGLGIVRAILGTVTEGLVVTNASGEVISYNQRFATMWKLPERWGFEADTQMLLAHSISMVRHPGRFKERIDQAIDAREHVFIDEVELLDGRIFERSKYPVITSDGEVSARVWCYREVSAQRHLAEQRLVVSERLASVAQFVASVTHDINNPLMSISANVDYVLSELEDDPRSPAVLPVREALEDVREGLDRIRVLVRDLGAFSRLDQQTNAPSDVRAILESAITMAGSRPSEIPPIELQVEPVPFVAADEARLSRVFLNLILNAAQSFEEVRSAGNVVVIRTAKTPAGNVRIEFEDNGKGLTEMELEGVFDPFVPVSPQSPGTGLRLVLCKNIVEKLGGTLRVQSELGRGSRFTIELPPAFRR